MNVLCIVGTRPDAIKMAPVVRALGADPQHFTVRLCVTAQHRDLLDGVLRFFELRPDDDLDLMKADQSLAELSAALLSGLSGVMTRHRPDWVLVQGDTTSSFVAALTAAYAGIRVAHIEAGLRTGRIDQPFPEEMNRLLISRLANRHFAPTERARQNLLAEGIADARITVSGNTSIDSLNWASNRTRIAPWDAGVPAGARIIFVTLHRRESFGQHVESICQALVALSSQVDSGVHFICTVHPNPRVAEPIRRILGGLSNVHLTDPLPYPDTVALLHRCYFVMTDSGGLQEEAPAVGRPVLVLRETTERPEGVDAGVAAVVGRSAETIVPAALSLLRNPAAYAQMARTISPYGDGHAARRIVDALRDDRQQA